MVYYTFKGIRFPNVNGHTPGNCIACEICIFLSIHSVKKCLAYCMAHAQYYSPRNQLIGDVAVEIKSKHVFDDFDVTCSTFFFKWG